MKLPEKILYAHEHTTIDLSGPKKNIDCRLDDFDATAAEYRRLAEHGVVGIIDQTNRGMGRNVAYVQKMAAQAGWRSPTRRATTRSLFSRRSAIR